MRNIILLSALALMAAGCTAAEQRTTGTALVGAGTGALIGGLANGNRGALVGAAVGGGTGAVVGAATAPRGHHRECWVRDRWGHKIRDHRGRPIRERC